jgi:ornithine cyclodeaminase/alanine dehydrogenase-like protein (mu-crystallin family)
MHLSCMQRDEAKHDCFLEADIVVFHTRMKEHEYVSTDFAAMEKRFNFVMRDHPPRELDWNDFPDLGELVAGKIKGRQNAQQRTFFLNSTGVGAQFTALAHLIFSGCRELGLGHEVPAQFFAESIQP